MGCQIFTFLLILLIHAGQSDHQYLCTSWQLIERILIHEAQQVNCTVYSNCSGMICSIHEYGYDITGGISIDVCETPPSLYLDIDAPKLNIKNWQRKFFHGEKFSLSETLGGVLDMERLGRQFNLALLIDIPSGIKPYSPLLHLIPSLASSTKYQVFKNVSVVVPPCSSLSMESSKIPIQSNCSILNSSCEINEICQQINKSSNDGICICINDFVRNEKGVCIYNPSTSTTEPPGGHSQPEKKTSNTSLLLTAILVPITVIVLAVVIVYVSIRFRVLQHLRRRLRVQVYEHVLLGQDEDENEDDTLNPVV